jgi:hypothetical protein
VASDSEPLERDRRTRQWRTAKIERFEERQRKTRECINFKEIAEWCSEEDGSIKQNENKRAAAFDRLANDLLAGEFDENGRSRVHFLHRHIAKKVTPEWFKDVIDHNWDGHHGRFILAHCWMHKSVFKRWRAKHRLPESAPRFEPQVKQFAGAAQLKKPKRGRPAEYNWVGVKSKLRAHVKQHGPVQMLDDLLQMCSDFANELHPEGKTPDLSTIRAAIKKHGLDVVAGMRQGK